jgi:hypothetical protein
MRGEGTNTRDPEGHLQDAEAILLRLERLGYAVNAADALARPEWLRQ